MRCLLPGGEGCFPAPTIFVIALYKGIGNFSQIVHFADCAYRVYVIEAKGTRCGKLTCRFYPLTEPTVKPLTKYFWKNGNITSAGPATTIAIAIRAVSAGISSAANMLNPRSCD